MHLPTVGRSSGLCGLLFPGLGLGTGPAGGQQGLEAEGSTAGAPGSPAQGRRGRRAAGPPPSHAPSVTQESFERRSWRPGAYASPAPSTGTHSLARASAHTSAWRCPWCLGTFPGTRSLLSHPPRAPAQTWGHSISPRGRGAPGAHTTPPGPAGPGDRGHPDLSPAPGSPSTSPGAQASRGPLPPRSRAPEPPQPWCSAGSRGPARCRLSAPHAPVQQTTGPGGAAVVVGAGRRSWAPEALGWDAAESCAERGHSASPLACAPVNAGWRAGAPAGGWEERTLVLETVAQLRADRGAEPPWGQGHGASPGPEPSVRQRVLLGHGAREPRTPACGPAPLAGPGWAAQPRPREEACFSCARSFSSFSGTP